MSEQVSRMSVRSSVHEPRRAAWIVKLEALLGLPELAGAALDLLLQLVVLALETHQTVALQRDVELGREEIGQVAVLVENWRDQHAVEEPTAVLAVIDDLHLDLRAALDRVAQLSHIGGIGIRPLKKSAVVPETLLALVAGQAQESVVDEDDRIVGLVGIGDQHRHPRRADGGCERVR
jgi:hypothetical protein